MKKELARIALSHIKACIKELEDSLVIVQDNCDADESTAYRRSIGHTLSEIQDRILDPIIMEHPDLVPEDIDYRPRPGPMLSDIGSK